MRLSILLCCLIPATLLLSACDIEQEPRQDSQPVEELRVYPVESVRAAEVVEALSLVADQEDPSYSVSAVDHETIMVRARPAVHATLERVLADLEQLRGETDIAHESPLMIRYWVVTMRPANGDAPVDPLLEPVKASLLAMYPAYSFDVKDHLEALLDIDQRGDSSLESSRGTTIGHSLDSRDGKLVLKAFVHVDPVSEGGAQQSRTNFHAPVKVGQPIVIQRSMIEGDESSAEGKAYQLVVVRVDPAPESG